jgi:hypothetical protein
MVPKHENFSLAFFTLSESDWLCDLETGKNQYFYQLTPDFVVFVFLQHTECVVKKKKVEARPKLKVGGSCSWAPVCMLTMFFFIFWFFYECLKIYRRVNFSAKTQYVGKNFYCLLNM